jgi:aquaporin Z
VGIRSILGALDVAVPEEFQETPRERSKPSERRGIEPSTMKPRLHNWPEYAIEGACLALFMVSATGFATLLQHPVSPVAGVLTAWRAGPLLRRIPMGLAMGLTAIGLIYSPLGARSGAHMNPSLTFTYYRLGKVRARDAAGYIGGQFAGGTLGILVATWLFHGLPADPSVNYAATVPGLAGSTTAFLAETLISFLMMAMVLSVSNTPALARYTGICAGVLVALYIIFEAPLSGMSMNPARTLGSNVLAHATTSLWIYFTAPPLGMLLAAEAYGRFCGRRILCAKLNHTAAVRCIFCGMERHP